MNKDLLILRIQEYIEDEQYCEASFELGKLYAMVIFKIEESQEKEDDE